MPSASVQGLSPDSGELTLFLGLDLGVGFMAFGLVGDVGLGVPFRLEDLVLGPRVRGFGISGLGIGVLKGYRD